MGFFSFFLIFLHFPFILCDFFDFLKILSRIFEELGLKLDSEDDLLNLIGGMSKDLNDIQYQCKVLTFE